MQGVIEVIKNQGQGAANPEVAVQMLEVKAGDIFRLASSQGARISRDGFMREVTLEFKADNRIEKLV